MLLRFVCVWFQRARNICGVSCSSHLASNKTAQFIGEIIFYWANKHKQRHTLFKFTWAVIYYEQIEFHGLDFVCDVVCQRICVPYTLSVQQDNCPGIVCTPTQTYTRTFCQRIANATAIGEKSISSYYLRCRWCGSICKTHAYTPKGKQIVRVTTINKSLHIYNAGKFNAFVVSYGLFFFSAARNINGCWRLHSLQVEMCERTNYKFTCWSRKKWQRSEIEREVEMAWHAWALKTHFEFVARMLFRNETKWKENKPQTPVMRTFLFLSSNPKYIYELR